MNDLDGMEPVLAGEKDRTPAVKAVGVMHVLLGALIALWVPLGFWAQSVMDQAQKVPTDFRRLIPAGALCLALAATFAVLGAGLLLRRRWARALALVVAWSWLASGIFSSGMIAAVLRPGLPATPSKMAAAVAVVICAALAGLLVLLPAWLICFFRGAAAGRVFAAAPADWTTACPLRVLGIVVWLAAAALMLTVLPFGQRSVLPCFGWLITGDAAALLFAGLAGICVWLARAVFRRDRRAWWWLVALVLAVAVSNGFTFSRVSLADLHRAMGYSAAQIAASERSATVNSHAALLWSQVLVLPALAYLLWVKRLFRADTPAPAPDSPSNA